MQYLIPVLIHLKSCFVHRSLLTRARRHDDLSTTAQRLTASWRDQAISTLEKQLDSYGGQVARHDQARHSEVLQQQSEAIDRLRPETKINELSNCFGIC